MGIDKNLYDILHVECSATFEEIRVAYRKLARIYHPDINENPDSIEIFKDIRYAYDILSNESKRKLYDIKYNFNLQKAPQKDENSDSEELKEQKIKKEKVDKKTNSKSFLEIFAIVLDKIFKPQQEKTLNKKMKPQKGEDIYTNVTISSKEALLGTNRIVNIMQTVICPNCSGQKFINEALCPLCKGLGEISNHKRINVKIPSNTKNHEKIKVSGAGNQGVNGGKSGDLYLVITIDEKSAFMIKDNIVYMELPITPYEAALGADIKIPTFYDDIILKIPQNTSSGQKFRLKGLGIVSKNKTKINDMIVTVLIKMPQKLSKKEIELYNELKECSSSDVREGIKNNE